MGKRSRNSKGVIMTRAGKPCRNWMAYSTGNIECTPDIHAGDVFLRKEAKNRRAINRVAASLSAGVSIRACLSRMAPISYQKLPNEPDRRNELSLNELSVRAASHTSSSPPFLAAAVPRCYASVHGTVIPLL